jgi:uncharacterized membrane protein YadS
VPLALGTASLRKSDARVQWPWFILWFCAAAVAASYLPVWLPGTMGIFRGLSQLGRSGLTVVLFLIGTGISRKTLRQVGIRPLLQGVILWVVVASVSLWAIHSGRIAL